MVSARGSRTALVLLKLGVSLVLVALVLGLADISEVGANLAAMKAGPAALAVGLCFSQTVLAGLRWHVLGHGTGEFVGRWPAMRVTFAAMFCNQLMPTSIGGDLVRAGLLARLGPPIGRAARTVVLDRTAGLLSLLTLMAVTGFVFGEQLPAAWPVNIIRSLPVAAIGLVLGGLFFGKRAADTVEARLRLPWLAQLLRDSSRLLRSGASTVVILAMSYGIHCASATSVWVLAKASGVEIDFLQVLGFLPIVILVQLIPVSIAGWGVREGTIVTLFGLLGISSAAAVAVSILWGAAIATGAILAGAVWAVTRPPGERLPDRETPVDGDGGSHGP
jgi:glycosyltransferase 2 family protein